MMSSLASVATITRVVTPLAACAVCVVACTSSDVSPSGPTDQPSGPGNAPATVCPAKDGATGASGPTKHAGDVKDGEVWTAAGSPHIVEEDVNVRDGAKLTIEPCAVVRFAAETHINVAYPLTPNTGSLVAEGTADKPISFAGDGGARWGSIYVAAPGTARIAHATFEDGGGDAFDHGATLVSVGDDVVPADPIFFVDNVTIKKSRGAGVWLQRRSMFVAGSKDLTITASGGDDGPYPLEISEQAIDTLPTGSYTGNVKDEILIRTEGDGGAASGLVADATLHERGVPYHMGDFEGDYFTIGSGADGKVVTLTIEPGVVMKFEPKTAFMVQQFSTSEPSSAIVRAIGTAEKPIVFTSASPTPKPGDWRGLWFGGVPQAANALEHVRIEYTGYDCGCSMVTCSLDVSEYEGAILFSQPPPSMFLKDSVITHAAGHGVVQGYAGAGYDWKESNSFDDVAGCPVTLPANPDTSCPDPAPACK